MPAKALELQSLRSVGGQTLRLRPDPSSGIAYIIERDDRPYARIACVPEVTLEAREGTWLVAHAGHRGWDLAATTARGAPAAWFQRSSLVAGGTLLVPDGTDYQLRRGFPRRSTWLLRCEEGWLTRYGVRTGAKGDSWDLAIDLVTSEFVSRHEHFPLLLLLSCYAVVIRRATERGTPRGFDTAAAPVIG